MHASEPSVDLCLPDLLWEQVRAQPDNVAVVQGDESLTFRELAEDSANLAAYFRQLGLGADDCVGIFVEPSLELMVGVWGVLFGGSAYLPLSPEYPEERLRYMIKDARVRVIFCQEKLKHRLSGLVPAGTRIVTFKDAAQVEQRLDVTPRPDNLAYVIYTSGSTGKPKGVMIEHRAIVNQMAWMADHHLDRDKVVLQKTPMSFDAAQWEILAPCCGSKVVMGRPGVYRDPAGLAETIAKHEVTTLQCVPTLLQALVDTEELGTCKSLTQIFSGGEVLSKALALSCLAELPWCTLVNLYGPTECTINSSAFTVDRDTVADGPAVIPIGTPVHNTQYRILDDTQAPVALGELYISGIQLARGYLNRPDLTQERFIDHPVHGKLFKTGDLACWNADGTVQFAGRADNQVKMRGFRVELDEIRLAIEDHDWVKNAAVIVKDDPRTGFQNLVAFLELNPKEAALMDQGNHGAHHQSKESRLQVRAQLSNSGCRDTDEIAGKPAVELPGRTPTPRQRQRVFARKTYRFFEGDDITEADIVRVLSWQVTADRSRRPEDVPFAEFGEILRYFGQFLSDERLLPKYGYASPGSLYATQLYFEINEIGELRPGFYYYHPVHHQLILISERPRCAAAEVKIHLVGKKRAIEPVYTTNIQEVLEIEAGHVVGLFDEVLPEYGLGVKELEYLPRTKDNLACAEEDYYLGSYEIVPYTQQADDSCEVYVQAHPGKVADLPAGQYHYRDGRLTMISSELVLRKHVIAINQQVYDRASFGITVVSQDRRDWLGYVDLGRKLQRLQMNDINLGFMSSGYSSKTGADLPSARRMASILNGATGPSYFFVGGRVSDEQLRSEGMNEDVVHMKGPAEMLRDDLGTVLPDYMMPNRITVTDKLPHTSNGKIDFTALAELDEKAGGHDDRQVIAPRTNTEERVSALWKNALRREVVSVNDDFFASGGNSLIAVGLVNKLNKEFHATQPLQVLFEAPTIEKLARKIDGANSEPVSRLVRLHGEGARPPIYCWPGLGGYPMNLRLLAGKADRPFYGVQSYGINPGETPYATIEEMAAEDVKMIRQRQPAGPYTLWGYSFGARIAFETAYQLEHAGEQVQSLVLIAPGSPKVEQAGESITYHNPAYVTILFSVFAGHISGPLLDECLSVAKDEESFVAFISEKFKGLDRGVVRRIAGIVSQTYQFRYTFHELAERKINAPVTIFKARDDDYSFIENSSGYSAQPPTVVDLEADHYGVLKQAGVDELINSPFAVTGGEVVPHVNIKHFPVALSEQQQSDLIAAVTAAVRDAFRCEEDVISIALEPVDKDTWNDRVYVPEIVNRKNLLRKTPNY